MPNEVIGREVTVQTPAGRRLTLHINGEPLSPSERSQLDAAVDELCRERAARRVVCPTCRRPMRHQTADV